MWFLREKQKSKRIIILAALFLLLIPTGFADCFHGNISLRNKDAEVNRLKNFSVVLRDGSQDIQSTTTDSQGYFTFGETDITALNSPRLVILSDSAVCSVREYSIDNYNWNRGDYYEVEIVYSPLCDEVSPVLNSDPSDWDFADVDAIEMLQNLGEMYDYLTQFEDSENSDRDSDGSTGDEWNQAKCNIFAPFPELTNYYRPDIERIVINKGSAQHDAPLHEYSHFVMDHFYPYPLQTYSGGHSLDAPFESISVEPSWNVPFFDVQGCGSPSRCAYEEGFATYLPLAARDNDHYYSVKLLGTSANQGGFGITNIHFEDATVNGYQPEKAQDYELTTIKILWDIADSPDSQDSYPSSDDDWIHGEAEKTWELMRDEAPTDILKFFKKWMEQGPDYKKYECALCDIYRKQGIINLVDDYPSEYIQDMYDPKGPHCDWDTYRHNHQRTGFTLMRGDLSSTSGIEEAWSYDEAADSTVFLDSPVAADIDNDGVNEIIITASAPTLHGDDVIYALNRESDGTWRRMWHFPTESDGIQVDSIWGAPEVADIINDDNIPEVAFSTSSGQVFVLNAKDGRPAPGWESPYVVNDKLIAGDSPIKGSIQSVSMVDLDNNGELEVVFADMAYITQFTSHVYVLDKNAKETESWYAQSMGPEGTLAFANLDEDDELEIVSPSVSGLLVLDNDGSELYWYMHERQLFDTPAVADVDKDGTVDIIYTTASDECDLTCNSTGFTWGNYTWKVDKDGNIQGNYSHEWFANVDPAIGDLDGDNSDYEIVTGENRNLVSKFYGDYWGAPYGGKIVILDSDMTKLCEFTDGGDMDEIYASPVIADIDNDDTNEVIFGVKSGTVYAISYDGTSTCMEEWRWTLSGSVWSSPAIADVDGDGYAEIIVKHDSIINNPTMVAEAYQEYGVLTSQGESIPFDPLTGRVYGVFTHVPEKPVPEMMREAMHGFRIMTSSSSSITALDTQNQKPELPFIQDVKAIEGDTIDLGRSASDPNDDYLTYSFTSPILDNARWVTTEGNSSGTYEVLASVSDGQLRDSQLVTVEIFRWDTTNLTTFNDTESIQTLNYTDTESHSLGINISNQSRVWTAELYLSGFPHDYDTTPDYQAPNATVIEANEGEIWANLTADGNWSSYYSAGNATGAIVELSNLTVPASPGHLIVRLRARVYAQGNGRFAMYNYNTDLYEVVTSNVPPFFDTYKDLYFDLYTEDPLWPTNSTHFSLQVDDISDFVNSTNNDNATRWYYRYINGEWASQALYESEVRFLESISYPNNITVDFGDDGIDYTLPGELHEQHFILDEFNDTTQNGTWILNNDSETFFLSIPKDAIITYAALSVGNQSVTDINATIVEVKEFETEGFEPQSAWCTVWDWEDWNTHSCANGVWKGYFGPYCPSANNWKYYDADNDNFTEAYLLTSNSYYYTNMECKTVQVGGECSPNYIDGFAESDGDPTYSCDAAPCGDSSIEDVEEDDVKISYSSSSSSITTKEIWCMDSHTSAYQVGFGPYTLERCKNETTSTYYNANNTGCIPGDTSENYLVLECGRTDDCAGYEYCNTSTGNPLTYTCDHLSCDPACNYWENETFVNHTCVCNTLPARCENSTTQLNATHYCDAGHYPEPISTEIYVNDWWARSVPDYEIEDVDITLYLRYALEDCTADTQGYCQIRVNFSTPWNQTKFILDSLEVSYLTPALNFTMQDYVMSCTDLDCNYPITVTGADGRINASLAVYYSPETPPVIQAENLTIYEGQYAVIHVADGENDTLNITDNSTLWVQNGTSILWYANYTNSGTHSFTITADDDLMKDSEEVIITVNNVELPVIDVSTPDELYSDEILGRTVMFSIENDNGTTVPNVNWTVDTDDSLSVESNISFNLSSGEDLFVFFYHNYTTPGSKTLKVNATQDDLVASSELVIDIQSLNTSAYGAIDSTNYTQTFRFWLNNQYTKNVSDINCTIDFGNSDLAAGEILFNLTVNETILVFGAEDYGQTGYFEVNFTASTTAYGVHERIMNYSVPDMNATLLKNTYDNSTEQQFRFLIKNTFPASVSAVNWSFDTGEENRSSILEVPSDNHAVIIVLHNYSSSGTYNTIATVERGGLISNDTLTIEVT